MKIQGKKVESPRFASSLAQSFGLALDEGVLELPEIGPGCAMKIRRISHPEYQELVKAANKATAESTTNTLSVIVHAEGAREALFAAKGKRKRKGEVAGLGLGNENRILEEYKKELWANPHLIASGDIDRSILNAAIGLVDGWSGFQGTDGPLEFNLDNLLAMLGWRGHKLEPQTELAKATSEDPKYMTAKAVEDLPEDDVLARLIKSGSYVVTDFVGPMSINGKAMTIAVDVEYELVDDENKPILDHKGRPTTETVREQPIFSEWLFDRVLKRAQELDNEREQNVALVHSDSTDGRVGSPAD